VIVTRQNTFSYYYHSMFFRAGRAFDELVDDHRSLRYGALALLFCAILYTLVYVFLILGGGKPFKPWLSIPEEVYYRYNVFFLAPSMFMGWILAGGTVHLLSLLVHKDGSFEKTLAVLGFGIGIASWTTGLHDFGSSFLGAIGVVDQNRYEVLLNSPSFWRNLLWIQFALYLAAFLVLFTKGIASVYRLNIWPSFLLGLTGFIVYQLFFLIFNR
jgi:hypothetical protein